MKKTLLALAVVAAVAAGQNAYATTFGDSVNYWTNWSNGTADDSMDVIGHPDITGGNAILDVDANGDRWTNTISFNNAGASWSDLAPSDLFINVLTGANDTTWDYIVDADTSLLFDISGIGLSAMKGQGYGDAGYLITDGSSGIRNYHPIAVDADLMNTRYGANPYGIVDLGAVAFSGLGQGFYTEYVFGNNAVNVGQGMGFILGWGMNCANDVVYEQVPVPEPATFVMLGAGLLGLGLYGRRKKQL